MPATTTKTKKAAPPAKPVAKRAPVAKKVAAPPPPSTNGDSEEPMIRVAFSPEDLTRLIAHIDGWEDSIVYRLKMRLARHTERWG